jgi:hypothetical protein
MDKLGEFVKTVCFAAIAFFIIENLISVTRIKGQMKFLLSLIFITLTASFFSGVDYKSISFEQNLWDNESYAASAEICNDLLEKQILDNLSEVIGDELNNAGIKNSRLDFEINMSQTNCIDISKVIINTMQYTDAENILRSRLGEEVKIINEAECG